MGKLKEKSIITFCFLRSSFLIYAHGSFSCLLVGSIRKMCFCNFVLILRHLERDKDDLLIVYLLSLRWRRECRQKDKINIQDGELTSSCHRHRSIVKNIFISWPSSFVKFPILRNFVCLSFDCGGSCTIKKSLSQNWRKRMPRDSLRGKRVNG